MTLEQLPRTALDETGSLRERKKNATRQAIEDAAWELFAERGFEATSVNDIAARANVAQRTFFRYFPVKEAVLFGDLDEGLEMFAEAFRVRPRTESPFASLIAAFDTVAEYLSRDPGRVALRLEIQRQAGLTPACAFVEGRVADLAIELVRERFEGDPRAELQARLAAGVLLVVHSIAEEHALEHGGDNAIAYGRMCLAELTSMLSHPAGATP